MGWGVVVIAVKVYLYGFFIYVNEMFERGVQSECELDDFLMHEFVMNYQWFVNDQWILNLNFYFLNIAY